MKGKMKKVALLVLLAISFTATAAAGGAALSQKVYPTQTTANAAETNCAKVGNVEYGTIDEAIAAWTNGTTLTLLSDVTLSDVVTLKSTEHHKLDLGTYTLTAAAGKNAIEITCNGLSSATYALTVNADKSNPGGITASGKNCIYYRKSGTTKDRPIIQINGGVFNGSYAINVYSSNSGTNCPQINIAGGTFDGNVNIGKGKLIISGGLFNKWINCSGDSTAYRQISGGTFKSWQFMTADASNKFWVGTSKENYNVGCYVDDNGYLVVGGSVITEPGDTFVAQAAYSNWSSYLQYSSAKDNGLYYTSIEQALDDNNKTTGNVTVYTDKIDLTGINYKGTLTIPEENDTLTLSFAEGTTPAWKVVKNGSEPVYTEVVKDGIVTRTYGVKQEQERFVAQNLTIGADLTVNYLVQMTAEEAENAVMEFKFEDWTTTVTVEPTLYSEGRYVFPFEKVAPQQMGDIIVASLVINGEEVAVKDDYSVATYAYNQLNSKAIDGYSEEKDAALRTLLVDMLNYGAAAQKYTGYKTEALVNAGLAELGVSGTEFVEVTQSDVNVSGSNGVSELTATLYHDKANAIRIYFEVENIDAVSVQIVKGGQVTEAAIQQNEEGRYYVQTDDILATQFGDVYYFNFNDGSGNVTIVSYSVKSYVKTMQNNATAGELVQALWNYGVAANVYQSIEQ